MARLGIVGCGAITEGAHLPAVLSSSRANLVALSDISEPRLHQLQAEFGLGPIGFTDYRQTFDKVDAVVLALPNTLHAPVACDFLSRGVHVLCEKPLATSRQEGEQMCRVAETSGAVLAVGYVTRFYPSTELTRELIQCGFLGSLQSFDYEFGTSGGWATVSGYNLARSTSGGGVLVVSGSHFIDRMLYLFGETELLAYSDDNYGGVEANCVAHFQTHVFGQALQGRVTLSKTHRLSNRLRITGEKGSLEVREGQSGSVTFFPAVGNLQQEISPRHSANSRDPDYFRVQLDDFLEAIHTGRTPRVDGIQGLRSVTLMEHCYETATRLDEPWSTPTLPRLRAAMPLPSNSPTASNAAKREP